MIKFLAGSISRLRSARWFNTAVAVRPISIMEHSYMVALISLLLSRHLEPAVRFELLARALVHDLEEAHSGDLSTLVKMRFSKEMRAEWGELMKDSLEQVTQDADPFNRLEIWNHWLAGKSGSAGEVLAAADLISMWVYQYEEFLVGNSEALEVMRRLNRDFIIPLPEAVWLNDVRQEIRHRTPV